MIAAILLALSAVPAAAAGYPLVRSDARVELLAAVRLLAGDAAAGSGFFRRAGAYENALASRLGPLGRHPVVERWQELEKAGLGYVPAYQWVLTLGEPPGLEARAGAPEALTRAAGGETGVEEFRLLLSDFAAAAEFMKRYAETEPLRAPLLDEVRRQAAVLRVREELERWAGLPAPEYELIVSPFAEPGVAVTSVSRAKGGATLTSLTGPEERGGKVMLRLSTLRGTLWAEALREMLRPAAAESAPALKRSRALFAPVAGRCAQDWDECALRQISFAAAGRLLARAGEGEAAAETPVKYARVGMPHLSLLMKELEAYERGRPGLAAYFPALAEALARAAAKAPEAAPFSGGIAEALAAAGPCALILPENPGTALSDAVGAFARAHRLCDGREGGPNAVIIVAGGLDGNPWLRARWKELHLPLAFVPEGLSVGPRPGEERGRVLTGALSLVTVARNPDDPSRPALIFAAPDAEGAARALAGFSGRFDYEIFDGTTAVKSGLYEKSRLPWRPK